MDSQTISMMEQLCSDKEHSELYVPTFKNNYSQIKIDGRKSHGKVFFADPIRESVFFYKYYTKGMM